MSCIGFYWYSDSTKGGDLLYLLSDYQLSEKESATWNYLVTHNYLQFSYLG